MKRVLGVATAVLFAATMQSAIAQQQPPGWFGGTYRTTCQNCRLNGSTMVCICKTMDGNTLGARIDVNTCPSKRFNNVNGRLVCD